jgi:DNA gyrase subunit A
MVTVAKEVLAVNIEDEMKQSYLDYAMSVIVGRALPDARDGLKPVHRRSLFAMNELGLSWNKTYKKSARVVGDVLGKYHPHGDSAVYDTIVRMAQDFSLRYPLVDGQGNFGSVDGDNAASMRYTEVRMAKIAHELLADIDKETVDFNANYDESEFEPAVFPTKIPNLLVNGSSGIAVGMATNIPPHNLTEVINACVALVDNPQLDIEQLMQYIPGPDFPTAAMINGAKGIVEAYNTGRGRIYVRAKTSVEQLDNGRERIVIDELPYQVNKARLLEKIAELVKDKKLDGISELRDESDKDGIRVAIELKRGENSDIILNNLFQQTQLQTVFGINMVALVDNQPKLLNLKQLLEIFLRHRREVVTRRTVFELRKARERAHILEGLAVALENIDEMIVLIKTANSLAQAKQALLNKIWPGQNIAQMLAKTETSYSLSEIQVQAILDLRLHRLTALEQHKILDEYQGLLVNITELLHILQDGERLMQVIRAELLDIKQQYADIRRTTIINDKRDLSIEDLISEEDVVVTLSRTGYVKAQPISSYQAQQRGGRGKSAVSVKDEDVIEKIFIANTHQTILCFSNYGRVYWLKVYELPQANRAARGKPIINLLPLETDERINTILPIKEFSEQHYVLMATAQGTVKKTALIEFSRPRSNGIIAINLDENDKLIGVDITDGHDDIMLFSQAGKAVRFNEQAVRPMGRTARGVRGIKLSPDDTVISLIITKDEQAMVLVASENGFGKRTLASEFSAKGRGSRGVIAIKTSERNGKVVAAILVSDEDDVLLISDKGTLIRTKVSSISVISRNTQGVSLIRLGSFEKLVGVEGIAELEPKN